MAKTKRVLLQDGLSLEEALIERQQQHLEKRRSFVTRLDELDKQYREEILALIGEEKYNKALPKYMKLIGELERPPLFDTSPDGLKKEEEHNDEQQPNIR